MNQVASWIETFGQWLEAVLLPFMALFVAEGSHFAAGLAFVLILAALLFCVGLFVFGVLPSWISLRLRWQRLKAVYKSAETPEERRIAFAKAFIDDIDPAFGRGFDNGSSRSLRTALLRVGRERQLRLAWSEFKETFIDESDREIQNTERPHDYFRRAISNPQKYGAFAGIFVSVGLLLTFIGIIAVLMKAGCVMNPAIEVCQAYNDDVSRIEAALGGASDVSAGADLGQSVRMQSAVISIVAGAASKFYASIGGLAAAIVIRILVGLFSSGTRKRIERLSDGLESGLVFIPEQRLAQLQLNALTEQTTQLKTFNTDLAVTLGDAMDRAMAPVASQLGNIERELSEQRSNITTGVGDAVNKMAGGEIREMGRVLGDLRTELSGLSGKLSEGGESAAQQISEASNRLKESIAAISSVSEQNTSRLDAIGSRLESLTGEFGAAAQASFQEAIKSSAAETARVAGEAGEKIRDAMSEAFEDWTQTLQNAVNGIDALAAQMTRGASTIETQVGALSSAAEATGTASSAMQSAASSFTRAADPVRVALESLNGAAQTIDGAIERLGESSSAAVAQAQAIGTSLLDTMQTAEAAWQGYSDRFGEVDDKLAGVLNSLAGSMESNAQRMRNYVAELDKELANAVTQFASAVQPLNNLADELEDLNQQLSQRLSEGDG